MSKVDLFRIIVGSGLLFLLAYLVWRRIFANTRDFFSMAFFRAQQIKKVKNNLRAGEATPGLRPGSEKEYIDTLSRQRAQYVATGTLLVVFVIAFLGAIWLILPF